MTMMYKYHHIVVEQMTVSLEYFTGILGVKLMARNRKVLLVILGSPWP